jgi:two-component system phosphate regulon response regulator PhoB
MTVPQERDRRRVLVVEDDPDLREVLRYNLEGAGYGVRTSGSGEAALEEWKDFSPDLMLLDVRLPGLSGFDVCRTVRAASDRRQPAIVMLTAQGDEIDRVIGFEIGANDYVVKPFSMRELLLRIRAHLRGAAAGTTEPAEGKSAASRRVFVVGPLELDLDRYRALVDGEEIAVSPLEMRLLTHLATAEGKVCTREELLTQVWQYSADVTTRTVDTHVKRLRDKLGRAGVLIQTVRGVGYRLSGPLTARRSQDRGG